jgi:hypothetical protein
MTAEIELSDTSTESRLRADDVSRLGLDDIAKLDVSQMTPSVIRRLEPEQLQALTPEQLRTLPKLTLAALTHEQALKMSRRQYAVLEAGTSTINDDPLSRVLRRRKAIKPGLSLVGDGYAQLADIASGPDATAAFGAGIELETMTARLTFVIRKGLEPFRLTDRTRFGVSILSPESESLFAGVDTVWFPAEFPDLSDTLFGFGAYLHAAQSKWEVALAAEPLVSVDTLAVTFAGSVGLDLRYVIAEGENYVDLNLYLGPGFRSVATETSADDDVLEALRADARVLGGTFKQNAIGTDACIWFSLDFKASMRINSVVVDVALPIVTGGVDGLSGFNFIASINLRTGAELIGF